MSEAGHIAVLLPSLHGGGAERSMLTLVEGFLARGRRVDLLLCKEKGALLSEVPAGARRLTLPETNGLAARLRVLATAPSDVAALLKPVLLASKIAPEISRIPALVDYLQRERPDAVLSALSYANLAALWARRSSRTGIPVVVSERNALHTYCQAPEYHRKWRWRYLPELVRRTYPGAYAVVGVSREACGELEGPVGLQHPRLRTLYNPVVGDGLREKALEQPAHPWFAADGPPVILAAGRLAYQKDFATLVRAFARVRGQREARLVILGEGRLEGELRELARSLGVGDDIDLPGFAENPFAFMARASVFVMSSRFEGLSGVLIQALACGCPVVSTDCPGGGGEILDDGAYGRVVPVGDDAAMAAAITTQLDAPTPRAQCLARAEDFSVDTAVRNYLALLDEAAASRGGG